MNRIADRAVKLLEESENPRGEMRWAESRLMEANLFNFPPYEDNPRKWAELVIAQNSNLKSYARKLVTA